MVKNSLEIMAPVGSYESLSAAIKAGANSVYFGAGKLNMRSKSSVNFTLEDLKKIAEICNKKGVKTYLTVNSVLYDEDLSLMKEIIDTAKKSKISAVICCDMAAINYAREIGVEVHMSTQTNISNIEAVKFYSKFADVVVLARELNLSQITNICEEIKKQDIRGPKGELVKVEIFIHGALCTAISGKCYMSLASQNSSANRGACLQTCRRSYKVIDEETGNELRLENKYIMSPKDLCTISFLKEILDSKVKVLKIEGRGRSPDYVYTVVKAYSEAIKSIKENTYTKEKIDNWIKELESVFNRGFWHGGYYLGNPLGEWAGFYGSKATKEKHFVGLARHYFTKAKIGEFIIQSGEIKVNDEILITGKTTGVIKATIESLYLDGNPPTPVKSAKKDNIITFPVKEKIRKGDKLYILKKREKFQTNSTIKE